MPDQLPRLHVAAGIIRDSSGRILLSQRPEKKHQGGKWEFPGGKVEPGESPHQALARELYEELGLDVETSEPFITIDHNYPDLSVRLMFRTVDLWQGEPQAKEQQKFNWFTVPELNDLTFPAANKPVVTALNLPDGMLITPPSLPEDWQRQLSNQIKQGVSLVYVRLVEETHENISLFCAYAKELGAKILIPDDVELATQLRADGLHITSKKIDSLNGSPPTWNGLLSMACHDEAQLMLAKQWQVDMVTLSPVKKTATHPDVPAMGWQQFSDLTTGLPFSVYALGGMSLDDLPVARENGARGVAAISAFWQ